MIEGAGFKENPYRDLLKLRETDYGEFLRLRQRLIGQESRINNSVPESVARKVLASYDGYSFEISEKRPLLAGIKKVAPVLIGGGFFGGMTAWMAFSAGGPVYPDAIIISGLVGGVIGHVLADHDRAIKTRERTNKLILSTYETL